MLKLNLSFLHPVILLAKWDDLVALLSLRVEHFQMLLGHLMHIDHEYLEIILDLNIKQILLQAFVGRDATG